MSLEEELKNERELNKERKEGNTLQSESIRLQDVAVRNVAEQLLGFRDIKRQIDDIVGITRRRSEEEQALLGIANELSNIGTQNFELARKGRKLDKLRNKLTGIQASTQSEILALESQLTGSRVKELDRVSKIVELQKEMDTMEQAINRQKIAGLEVDESALDKIKELIRIQVQGTEEGKKVLSQDAMRLIGLERLNSGYEATSEILGKTEKTQKNINQVTGITGELLEGVNRIGLRVLGGLGVNLGVISESFEVGREAMVEFGKEVSRTREIEEQLSLLRGVNLKTGEGITAEIAKQLGLYDKQGNALKGTAAIEAARVKKQELIDEKAKSTSDTFVRTRSLLKGLTALSGQLGKVLTDPVALAAMLFKHFGDLNKEAVRFQRLTGQTPPLMDTMNMRLATTVQYLEVASSLSERLGMNVAGAFSSQNLAAAAELMNVMGMTAEQAGQLALVSEINRTTVDNTLDTIVSQVNAYNRTNRTALNHGQIVNDIAKASEETLASFAGQPQKLTQAAAAARRLGLELSQVETIADSLLNFETSIENELQAQLITGQNINLAKARELALSNDIAGVGEEIFNNTVDVEKFSRMNRIEQQSLAQALGMSRQELGRIALQRGVEVGLTNQALENAAGMTAEDFKRVEAMQQLTIAIQKIGQALAGPVEAMSRILGNTAGLYTVLGLIAAIYGIKILAAVKAFQTNTKIANTGLVAQKALATGIANELTRAAVASQSIRPAFPGAAVGRGAGGKFTSMGAGAAGSVGAGAAMAGGKLAAKGLLRFIPYVGWALLAFDVLKMLSSSKPKEIKDGIISPDGGLMVSGPRGSIQLDPQDSIIAGTDLNTNRNNSTSQNNDRLIRKIDELIMAVKEGGDVFMDSSKVGESLALGTYKSS